VRTQAAFASLIIAIVGFLLQGINASALPSPLDIVAEFLRSWGGMIVHVIGLLLAAVSRIASDDKSLLLTLIAIAAGAGNLLIIVAIISRA